VPKGAKEANRNGLTREKTGQISREARICGLCSGLTFIEVKAQPDGTARGGLAKDSFVAMLHYFRDMAKRLSADQAIADFVATIRPRRPGCG